MRLSNEQIWLMIGGAAAISFVLRAAPFVFSKQLSHLSSNVQRLMSFFTYAVIGSLIGDVVFEPVFAARVDFTELGLRLVFLPIAFLLAVKFKKQTRSLVIAYSLFALIHILWGLHG